MLKKNQIRNSKAEIRNYKQKLESYITTPVKNLKLKFEVENFRLKKLAGPFEFGFGFWI
jgi:hypothetical protein